MYPDAPFIKRNGEVNAWDNPDFRKAVEATGRKQVILGGIVTEVCELSCCSVNHQRIEGHSRPAQALCFSLFPSAKLDTLSGRTQKPAELQRQSLLKMQTGEWNVQVFIW